MINESQGFSLYSEPFEYKALNSFKNKATEGHQTFNCCIRLNNNNKMVGASICEVGATLNLEP
jgi:hypothetical protein